MERVVIDWQSNPDSWRFVTSLSLDSHHSKTSWKYSSNSSCCCIFTCPFGTCISIPSNAFKPRQICVCIDFETFRNRQGSGPHPTDFILSKFGEEIGPILLWNCSTALASSWKSILTNSIYLYFIH